MQYSDTHESLNSPETATENVPNQDENESLDTHETELYDERNNRCQTPFTRTCILAERVPELIPVKNLALKHRLEYYTESFKKKEENLKSKRQIKEVITKIRIEEKEIELLNKHKKRMKLQKDSESSQSESENSVSNDDEAHGSSTEPSTSSGVFVQQNSNNENSKIDYSTRKHLICKHLPIQRKKKGFNILFLTSETCQKNCLTRNRPDRAKNKNPNEKHKHYIVSMINPDKDLWQLYKDENGKRKNGWGRSEKIKNKSHHDKIVKVNKMKRSSKSSL